MTIEVLKETYQAYKQELDEWTQGTFLTNIRDYKEYHNPQVWGQDYKQDQHYFEEIARNKNIVFGVISLVEQLKEDGDRVVKTQADNFIKVLDTDLKKLDNLLFTARERLRFYENIMRVMGNITWGSY